MPPGSSSLVKLIDRCDRMIDDMKRFSFDPGEILAFRDVVIDSLHGAEEELAAADAAATEGGIKVRVWTRQPISFMRLIASDEVERPSATGYRRD